MRSSATMSRRIDPTIYRRMPPLDVHPRARPRLYAHAVSLGASAPRLIWASAAVLGSLYDEMERIGELDSDVVALALPSLARWCARGVKVPEDVSELVAEYERAELAAEKSAPPSPHPRAHIPAARAFAATALNDLVRATAVHDADDPSQPTLFRAASENKALAEILVDAWGCVVLCAGGLYGSPASAYPISVGKVAVEPLFQKALVTFPTADEGV